MAEENTVTDTASSPPSFMQNMAEKVEEAKTAAQRAAAKEEEAAQTDDLDIRAAAIVKATNRLKDIADYMVKINKVVGDALPEFIAKNSLGQIVDLQISFENEVSAVEDQLKTIKAYVSEAREIHLPQRLDDEDTRTHTSTVGNRMSRTTRILASIRPGTKDDAFNWLRKPVFYEEPTADEAKIIAALRERIEAGEEVSMSEFPPRRPKFPWELNAAGEVVLSDKWNDSPPDYGSLIQPTVNSSSLSALAKELVEVGQEMPPELFNVHVKDGVSITKAAGTKKPPAAKKGKR